MARLDLGVSLTLLQPPRQHLLCSQVNCLVKKCQLHSPKNSNNNLFAGLLSTFSGW